MPRMIDLIRASALPATRMHAAARGALAIPAAEMIEILVHLANHNKIFAQQAKLTLAGWEEGSAVAVASDANSPPEVLEYMISLQNLRPCLLPALLENPAVKAESIIQLATVGARDIIEAILKSKRCSQQPAIQAALAENPKLRETEAAVLAAAQSDSSSPTAGSEESGAPVEESAPTSEAEVANTPEAPDSPAPAQAVASAGAETQQSGQETKIQSDAETFEEPGDLAFAAFPPDPEADEALAAYMSANTMELAAEEGKPFQAIGGIFELPTEDATEIVQQTSAVAQQTSAGSVATASASHPHSATAAKPALKKPHVQAEGQRDNTLQKINKLDVKGRIQLAIKGTKEERSILIRDGTKIVALAVLESPKLADSEVEHFASQKNVLEAVLRAIPMKRRFAKQYSVLRNLVFNPRTPLDVSLGLMKHMLTQDLRHLSSNKEVSDTVRKLALKMFKQKTQAKPGE